MILYLSHIETGDDWDMWDSAVATEQIIQQGKGKAL